MIKDFNIEKKVDLNKVIRLVLNDLEIRTKETDADIQIKKLPDLIHADEIQMRQLFQNLISNAIKFRKTDENPRIVIDSTIVDADKVPFEEAKDLSAKQYWKIDIADNGIGFDQQYKQKIFAVFQRLHGRSAYEGTGIGLSVCKKICENHKGFISASSEDGIGSTFSIYLPTNK
jgi:signal transduction histidine kinase